MTACTVCERTHNPMRACTPTINELRPFIGQTPGVSPYDTGFLDGAMGLSASSNDDDYLNGYLAGEMAAVDE